MLLIQILMLLSPKTLAWENHQLIQERIIDTIAAKRRIYAFQTIQLPCGDAEKNELLVLSHELQINAAKITLFSNGRCKPGQKMTDVLLSDVLTSGIIDEPDLGMDQNLPESADPKHDRRWMGGETGPTSQGFRHMYFPGFEFGMPLKTAQIPLRRVGEALDRIRKLRAISDLYFSRGQKFWGTRVMLWEIHYIQDLQQPFHVIQIPSLRMLPARKIFSSFIQASTHAIANYHYAYEGLVEEMMSDSQTSDFSNCFEFDSEGPSFSDPADLINLPRTVGNELGREVYQFFGDSLKTSAVDLPNGVGQLDYYALIHRREPTVLPDDDLKQLSADERDAIATQSVQWQAFQNVKRITCNLIKNVVRITWDEIDRSYLKPGAASKSNSNNNGK